MINTKGTSTKQHVAVLQKCELSVSNEKEITYRQFS